VAPDPDDYVPALVGEEHVCAACDLHNARESDQEALAAIRRLPELLRASVAAVAPERYRRRARPDEWSITEYVCHLRDVHTVYTVRLHRARTEDRPVLEPMFNDLRARRFRYNERDVAVVLDEVAVAAAGCCEEIELFAADDWGRVVTRLPGEERTARWLARQAMHEGIHHVADIRRIGG
jgi:hypothetical protein